VVPPAAFGHERQKPARIVDRDAWMIASLTPAIRTMAACCSVAVGTE
jgi:hypothetical protein